MMNITTSISVDRTNKMVNDLLALAKKVVYVGVPEETSARKEGEVSNAYLAAIHDNGSPLQGIPARPFMDPGIAAVQSKINGELLQVAKAQLNGEPEKVDLYLNRVGLIASSSIKNVINEGVGFTPLKRATLLGRLRNRKAARKWDKDKREETMTSMHPLIDTGQLRNAISYAIVDKE